MKVRIQKLDTDKTLIIEADRIAIKAPELQDYMIEAEVDEGDSPIKILASNGQMLPVKRLQLAKKETYRVKPYRSKGTGPYAVPSHERRKPTRLKTYARKLSQETKDKISKAMKKRFASLTPEQRRQLSDTMREIAIARAIKKRSKEKH